MNLNFIMEFLKNPKKIGAIAPSSKYLARQMTPRSLIQNADTIVELGAGQGNFTRELVRKKQRHTQLVVIESNQNFYEQLSKEYQTEENVIILNESAERLTQILERLQIPKIDIIVSGLPFSSLGVEISTKILKQVNQHLDDEGQFLTFQYSRFREALFDAQFKKLTHTHVMLNLPPAYVYQAHKKG